MSIIFLHNVLLGFIAAAGSQTTEPFIMQCPLVRQKMIGTVISFIFS